MFGSGFEFALWPGVQKPFRCLGNGTLVLLRTFLHASLPSQHSSCRVEWMEGWLKTGRNNDPSFTFAWDPPRPLHFAALAGWFHCLEWPRHTHPIHLLPVLQAVVQSCLQHLPSLSWGPQGPLFLLWGLYSRRLHLLCGTNPHSALCCCSLSHASTKCFVCLFPIHFPHSLN